jgi:hypothetical protein
MWSPWSLSSELFYLLCEEILESEFIHRSRKLSPSAESQGCRSQAAGHISLWKGWGPPSQMECKIPDEPQVVGIKDPLVLKTDTQETKSWQGSFSWSRACKHVPTPAKQACKHKMADSGSSLHPWHSCTCPSPGICPGQRLAIFLYWLKGLGDGLGHIIWWASRRRSKACLNMQVT